MSEVEKEQIVIEIDSKFLDFFRPLFWMSLKRLWLMFLLFFVASLFSLKEFFFGNTDSRNILNFLPIVFLLILFWSVFASARKFAKLMEGSSQYIFSEKEVDIIAPNSASQIEWSFFERAVETQYDFLLFQTKTRFHSIPKRFFKNSDQMKSLTDITQEAVKVIESIYYERFRY